MFKKIIEIKDDAIQVLNGIDDTLINSKYWGLWYFVKGHIEGCIIVYWFIVLTALITKRKWNLVDEDS